MKIRPHQNLSNKQRSQRSERQAAKFFGGRVQPASGALPSAFLKGDVKSKDFLVDDKITGARSYSISLALWKKLAREAWMNGRKPVFRLAFDSGTILYVIDELTFSKLVKNL